MGTEVGMGVSRVGVGSGESCASPSKPMTINNVDLNASCLKIRALAGKLEECMRDARVSALCEALADIECEAREAGYLVNDMIWKKK